MAEIDRGHQPVQAAPAQPEHEMGIAEMRGIIDGQPQAQPRQPQPAKQYQPQKDGQDPAPGRAVYGRRGIVHQSNHLWNVYSAR